MPDDAALWDQCKQRVSKVVASKAYSHSHPDRNKRISYTVSEKPGMKLVINNFKSVRYRSDPPLPEVLMQVLQQTRLPLSHGVLFLEMYSIR